MRATAGTRLAAAIAPEKLDEFGNPIPSYFRHAAQPRNSGTTTAKRKRATKATNNDQADTDVDDEDFESDDSSESAGDAPDDANTDIMEISNEEVLLSTHTCSSTTC
jgi:hypothetical protein